MEKRIAARFFSLRRKRNGDDWLTPSDYTKAFCIFDCWFCCEATFNLNEHYFKICSLPCAFHTFPIISVKFLNSNLVFIKFLLCGFAFRLRWRFSG